MSTVLVTWRDNVGFEYTDEKVLSENVAQFTADIDACQGTWVSETWTVNGRQVTITRLDDNAFYRLVVVGSHDAIYDTLEHARAAVAAEVGSADEA